MKERDSPCYPQCCLVALSCFSLLAFPGEAQTSSAGGGFFKGRARKAKPSFPASSISDLAFKPSRIKYKRDDSIDRLGQEMAQRKGHLVFLAHFKVKMIPDFRKNPPEKSRIDFQIVAILLYLPL